MTFQKLLTLSWSLFNSQCRGYIKCTLSKKVLLLTRNSAVGICLRNNEDQWALSIRVCANIIMLHLTTVFNEECTWGLTGKLKLMKYESWRVIQVSLLRTVLSWADRLASWTLTMNSKGLISSQYKLMVALNHKTYNMSLYIQLALKAQCNLVSIILLSCICDWENTFPPTYFYIETLQFWNLLFF